MLHYLIILGFVKVFERIIRVKYFSFSKKNYISVPRKQIRQINQNSNFSTLENYRIRLLDSGILMVLSRNLSDKLRYLALVSFQRILIAVEFLLNIFLPGRQSIVYLRSNVWVDMYSNL